MKEQRLHQAFYEELASKLATSSGKMRSTWATYIIANQIDLLYLANFYKDEQRTLTRFLWMMSDVGIQQPSFLYQRLSELFQLSEAFTVSQKTSFASFWLITGIPEKDEAMAINQLFEWILMPTIQITIKSRAILVLTKLTHKHPALTTELMHCIMDQKDKYTKDFEKRCAKVLQTLDKQFSSQNTRKHN